MDYNHIATTVEYSFVGLNKEEAIKQYGEDNNEI
jgi:hypothetical protein